jgi:hypothetical protein
MIQISYPFNWPNSFKLKAKHPMKSRNNSCASCTSPPITIRPILASHVFMITCSLGWDDGSFPTPKVEGMACHYYAECGEMPPCFGAPQITKFLFHTNKYPFTSLIPQMPRMQTYFAITSPPPPSCTNITNPIKGATCEKWVERVGVIGQNVIVLPRPN